MELPDKKLKKDKWHVTSCLLCPTAKADLEKLVRSNREKYPKDDLRCSVSGLIRLWVNEHLYPIPNKPEEKKEEGKVLKLAG